MGARRFCGHYPLRDRHTGSRVGGGVCGAAVLSHERGQAHETPDTLLGSRSGVTSVGALRAMVIITHNVIVTPADGLAGAEGTR